MKKPDFIHVLLWEDIKQVSPVNQQKWIKGLRKLKKLAKKRKSLGGRSARGTPEYKALQKRTKEVQKKIDEARFSESSYKPFS